MQIREEWIEKMLALPESDRAYMAEKLEQSLHTPSVSPEIASAWSAEIDRRIAAYDKGETAAIDFSAALHHMRQALAEHRA